MTEKKSIWGKADSFLSLTRKIIVNGVTGLVLVVITLSILGGVTSIFSGSDEVETKDKILWFKPVGVVVDSEVIGQGSFSLNKIVTGGSTQSDQHELQDLLDVLDKAANDENLSAVYVNVSELGMYWASAFKLADAVKSVKDSGKQVIAYSESYGNSAYLISSQANKVFVNN